MIVPCLTWTCDRKHWIQGDIEHMTAAELGSLIFLLLHNMHAKEIHINK